MNSSYGGGKGRRRQSKDHHPRVVPVVDDPDIPHSSYPPHHSQSYTPPHDMRRETSHSRTRRGEVDNWQQRGETSHSAHDNRYNHSNHNESHRQGRGSREIYERQDHVDVDAWQPRPRNDHYASSSRDWVDDYAYPSSSYNEPSYSTVLPARSSAYDWGVEDDHRLQENGHRYGDEPPARGWGREPPRDNGGTQPRFVSDSGWDTRVADRGYVDDPRGDDSRKWEPAPTWNQGNRSTNNRNPRNQQHNPSNGNINNRNNKNGKGKKQWNKNHKNNDKGNRDWKTPDDSHLNNWTKRDNQGPSSVNRIPLKRRQPRSHSRSRSNSPAASFYSRRSGRSRSRSPSPKRMRQSASPFRQNSSPINQKRQKRSKRRNRNSPQAARDRGRPRQRTASPPSRSSRSVSSASSRSSKDVDRPRTVHRLPTATPINLKDIDISLSMSKAPVVRTPRKASRGFHQPPSPTWDDPRPVYPRAENEHFSSSMPPPPLPYSASAPDFPPHHQYEDPIPDTIPPQGNRSKNAGFRPIGQNSSSLRKFFPGDEEEEPLDPPTPRTRSDTLHADVPPEFLEPEPAAEEEDITNMSLSTTPVQDPPRREFFQEEPVDVRPAKDPRRAKATNGHTHSDPISADVPESNSRKRNDLYSIMSQVGEGTFGKVYKARNTSNGLYVALKRVRMEAERDGFPVTAMREIKLLQSLRHPNVVCLHEMMVSNGSVYMVFEYMDHDLTGILSQTQFSFTDAQLKSLCHQMLAGLAYLHHKGVIHRDIKGSNILVNNRGELKLADFGLARFYQKRRQSDYTNRVITLWYRPPELLFGTTVYGPEVDMWSAGCIMLELFTKKPVFQGNDEIHQLDVMYKVLGTPTSERWPGITGLPWYELIKPRDAIPSPFKDLFKKWLSPCGLQLAEQLLDYDPARRITAVQALQHPYFNQEDPTPEIPVGLSTLEGEWHELETKREKARKRKKEGSVH